MSLLSTTSSGWMVDLPGPDRQAALEDRTGDPERGIRPGNHRLIGDTCWRHPSCRRDYPENHLPARVVARVCRRHALWYCHCLARHFHALNLAQGFMDDSALSVLLLNAGSAIALVGAFVSDDAGQGSAARGQSRHLRHFDSSGFRGIRDFRRAAGLFSSTGLPADFDLPAIGRQLTGVNKLAIRSSC